VLDDDEATSTALGAILEDEGFVVLHATTVAQARRVIEKGAVTLVLVDLALGEDRGRHLLDDLAGLAHAPPMLVVSGAADAEHVASELSIACVKKPFGLEELVAAINVTQVFRMKPEKKSSSPTLPIRLRYGFHGLVEPDRRHRAGDGGNPPCGADREIARDVDRGLELGDVDGLDDAADAELRGDAMTDLVARHHEHRRELLARAEHVDESLRIEAVGVEVDDHEREDPVVELQARREERRDARDLVAMPLQRIAHGVAEAEVVVEEERLRGHDFVTPAVQLSGERSTSVCATIAVIPPNS
jgi:CheY-like chemotaxis protein